MRPRGHSILHKQDAGDRESNGYPDSVFEWHNGFIEINLGYWFLLCSPGRIGAQSRAWSEGLAPPVRDGERFQPRSWSALVLSTSASVQYADIRDAAQLFRNVPKADSCTAANIPIRSPRRH